MGGEESLLREDKALRNKKKIQRMMLTSLFEFTLPQILARTRLYTTSDFTAHKMLPHFHLHL
jgi:hypothetical protein